MLTCSRQLDYRRDTDDDSLRNLLRLRCTNAADGEPDPTAVFFLNGQIFLDLSNQQPISLERPVERVNVAVGGGEILFLINREAEGSYSCGAREGSNSLALQFVGKIFCGLVRILIT